MSNNTDTLAAMIIKAQARARGGAFSDAKTAARNLKIDGMCTAWEHLTGETATEEALAEAAAKVTK